MANDTLVNLRAAFVIRELEQRGQGVRFDCPVCNCGCDDKRITVWLANPIGGGRPAVKLEGDLWSVREGESLADLTLMSLVQAPCGHLFDITNGVVSWHPS